ncbi:two component transcriptional regulator, LuxR family [Mucilaginibacter lappiensis]|uniref:DNA-binding NarL/FixJ family response regulator n=1 Tax=Mucilaginibacter lappiensis TaxID=354630 RepID=A0ABR6PH66_9SPHI|nr:response regulator transcription factor [Mucilaginibacter lappiensis]MBB6109105.1 DNA-binding NarL/FixJ family response regulator [Mucilaginibacter lappiensis]SIQ75819.1 two component transcriptional regulator, LuxR family [Mucilaginibacter lappiensis]
MLSEKINIAIVDDHTLFRQGVSRLLSEFEDIHIVFDAGNGAEMIERIKANTLPQVVIMDITMPVMDGYEATLWLKTHYPDVHVLALSMFEDEKPIIKMLRNGAGGYMLKESKTTDLVNAIKTIAQQGFFINDNVTGKLLRAIQSNNLSRDPVMNISANEQRFLELCCLELTYKEIADKMNLSPHTIDNYREALFQRFDIKSRTGLVLFAIKHELIKI